MTDARRSVALLALAVVVGTALLGGSLPSVSAPAVPQADHDPAFVSVGSGELMLWPYVAVERSVARPASSINVVFEGDADRVRRLLTGSTAWNATADGQPELNPGDPATAAGAPVPWRDVSGASRYTLTRRGGTRSWTDASYQLHRGDYLGAQHHLRVYELDAEVVAVQAHTEHWDWFLLTHVVDSLQAARLQVEDDFMNRATVDDVRRTYFANGDTYDADGWVTVIRLAFVLPLVGIAAVRSTTADLNTARNRWRLGLAASLPALLLGVRVLGIAAERALPVPVDVMALLIYPFVAVGLPVAAYSIGRRLRSTEAFAIAAVAFVMAVRVDYAILAVSVIPIEVVVHRTIAAVSLGLLAAGSDIERRAPRPVVVGAGLWLAVLLAAVV